MCLSEEKIQTKIQIIKNHIGTLIRKQEETTIRTHSFEVYGYNIVILELFIGILNEDDETALYWYKVILNYAVSFHYEEGTQEFQNLAVELGKTYNPVKKALKQKLNGCSHSFKDFISKSLIDGHNPEGCHHNAVGFHKESLLMHFVCASIFSAHNCDTDDETQKSNAAVLGLEHDCGKSRCNKIIHDSKTGKERIGSPGHGVAGSSIFMKRNQKTFEPNLLCMFAVIISMHMNAYGTSKDKKDWELKWSVAKYILSKFSGSTKYFLSLAYADHMGKNTPKALKSKSNFSNLDAFDRHIDSLSDFLYDTHSKEDLFNLMNYENNTVLWLQQSSNDKFIVVDTLKLTGQKVIKIDYEMIIEQGIPYIRNLIDTPRKTLTNIVFDINFTQFGIDGASLIKFSDIFGRGFTNKYFTILLIDIFDNKTGEIDPNIDFKELDSKHARGKIYGPDITLPMNERIITGISK